MQNTAPASEMRLYSHDGERLYINSEERQRFLHAALRASPDIRRLCLTLLYTGCRVSEALELKGRSLQQEAQLLTFRTLKRRRHNVFREVPIPTTLVNELSLAASTPDDLLWPNVHRSTAYRAVKSVMSAAQISGAKACPKGLRHGFGHYAVIVSLVPLNIVQKWMGHASMKTTTIYANAVGPEELALARRMWNKPPLPDL
ncbi:MAG: site-specific integrase [Pseudomonadota bacterium]